MNKNKSPGKNKQFDKEPIIFTSQADLNPTDHVCQRLFNWCKQLTTSHILVMESGLVLTTDLYSRDLQNCRVLMREENISILKIAQATPELIEQLLESYEENPEENLIFNEEALSNTQEQLRALVLDAIKHEVSDIHLEVRANVCCIRFRRQGDLILFREWSATAAKRLCFVAFNKESDHLQRHFNPLVPQDAAMQLRLSNGSEVRVRLASIPAHPQPSFDVTLRILATVEELSTFAELGYSPAQEKLFNMAMRRPHGAIIVAGPTGSGKTTTLATCLRKVPAHRKIYTIEDPVEKIVSNASQVPVNTEKDDRGFANMARQTLRMDPDCISIGEVRDSSTATMMARAAITGHLVLTTLHTNSAINIVSRLNELGLSRVFLADPNFLVLLVFQRLVNTLCNHCKKSIYESHEHKAGLPIWKKIFGEQIRSMYVRGKNLNCIHCNGRGVNGRIVVAETIWVDNKSRIFIENLNLLDWQNYLIKQGFITSQMHAFKRVTSGQVDVLDAEAVVGQFDPSVMQDSFDYHSLADGVEEK
jgi:type II secretory ATPase GspE/PulE/Tfp pilus assembly ATPase PilB-like protein